MAGEVDAGVALLSEAFAGMDETGERYGEAEIHRLRGTLLLRLPEPDADGAEVSFRRALRGRAFAERAVARAPRGHELEPALGRPGQAHGSAAAPGGDLRLVHGRPRHARPRGSSCDAVGAGRRRAVDEAPRGGAVAGQRSVGVMQPPGQHLRVGSITRSDGGTAA